jgi:hypothetical protein
MNDRVRRIRGLIRRYRAEKFLVEGKDCEFCTPTREVIAVNESGARALGFTHEPGCWFAEHPDDPAVEAYDGEVYE